MSWQQMRVQWNTTCGIQPACWCASHLGVGAIWWPNPDLPGIYLPVGSSWLCAAPRMTLDNQAVLLGNQTESEVQIPPQSNSDFAERL
jgi:hypothetical protein